MKAYKVTTEQMEEVLRKVNEKYQDNIRWKRFEQNGSGVHFTLTVNSSSGAGGRRSGSQFQIKKDGKRRRIAAACWHVHGDFFDALFDIAPNAYVRSMGRRIDKTQGNWQDRNIGSQAYPFMYSDACDCNESEDLMGV